MNRRSFILGLLVVLCLSPAHAARDFDGTSAEYLHHAGVTVNDFPFTVNCWFNTSDTDGQIALFSASDASDANEQYLLALAATNGSSSTGKRVIAKARDGGWTDGDTAVATADYTVDQWEMATGVYASATDRRAFLNGGNKGTSTGNEAPTVAQIDVTDIGRLGDSTPNWEFLGEIASCGIWDVALSDTEISSLYNSGAGVAYSSVSGADLIHCWDMDGASPEPDLYGTEDMTVNGTPVATTTEPPAVACGGTWGITSVGTSDNVVNIATSMWGDFEGTGQEIIEVCVNFNGVETQDFAIGIYEGGDDAPGEDVTNAAIIFESLTVAAADGWNCETVSPAVPLINNEDYGIITKSNDGAFNRTFDAGARGDFYATGNHRCVGDQSNDETASFEDPNLGTGCTWSTSGYSFYIAYQTTLSTGAAVQRRRYMQ